MTSRRIAGKGRFIDSSSKVAFTFDGRRLTGHPGDTLASAVLGAGQVIMGRSFKYHRPRGPVAAGPEEPNALVELGQGNRFEPNQRATTTALFDGLYATSQNRWPSLEYDIGGINAKLARLLPAGFYYKTFMYPREFWKDIYEPFIRKAAGLGKAPTEKDPDTYEHVHYHTDITILGGGVAGLQAALTAASGGARVLLLEQSPHWGGRVMADGGEIDGKPAADWVAATITALEEMDNVTMRLNCMGAGVYDHGYLLGYERLRDDTPSLPGPRHRLWRIRSTRVITATGAIERPLSFAGNDIPGVMLASAVRDYLELYGVAVGRKVVVVTNNDDGYRTAIALKAAYVDVPCVIDARPLGGGPLMREAEAMGIPVERGRAIGKVKGGQYVEGVAICSHDGSGGVFEREIECDAVAMSGGWSPVVHLWSHCGGKLTWDAEQALFRPDAKRPPTGADGEGFVLPAGAADGELLLGDVLGNAHDAGREAAKAVGKTAKVRRRPVAVSVAQAPILPVWMMPARAGYELRSKAWLDYQNDVKVSDVALAAQEGYQSVEHTKRYTTLGMATDQGKLSNINGLAVLSDALGQEIPVTGTTTFRPPYTPISMGAIAGEARGKVFQPVRRTPMHDWHDTHGADWEPVGQWRRPYAYVRRGETVHDAVTREVKNVRQGVGILDASTLGKILVKGPDAGKFLDMMYTNMMSTLAPGKCRYGLMCSENGFLMDDGVVARIDEDTWLCHTTTGGADHIHAHMEEWLQTEWWDWKVWTANLTEQYAQIAVVGPRARTVLEALGGMRLHPQALPFMSWTDGQLAGFDVRVFRISFSGELSFEIAVKAGHGPALWEKILEAGAECGIQPYGTEALHVLRAEKGYIMIGDETDGTVIPQDLGLNWAISKKKDDFIGKRAQERVHMADPDRWKLVGLLAYDDAVLRDGAYAVAEGRNANGQRNVQGRVTSTYYSPTLGRGIAMGLVHDGPNRMGEVLDFPGTDGKLYRAQIVDPVFYDKSGGRLHG
ncbi:sarcosine oxidase subunit alpha family protein [Marinibacterium profundimaris]|uniref:Sarcosine oxidase subunit alpha n=1 Tax=Marinibacterium profundimaris TaxID=1679460 RepID=A0A225NQQ7_9RHOB|nr:sarcosine oxidase subunit alpha family protein [Marinibacterium profundimaris]OWU77225.1 sarcosine oxidase subunit alpha [Marinibacterium profundimaris]